MVGLARAGRRVVRLKGGDPTIFGRAAEEIAACRQAGVTVEVVPGITAAQGAASRLGVSLSQRSEARRVQFVTGHGSDGRLPDDLDWPSLADARATTALYMPARTLAEFAAKVIAAGLDPATPAIAVSRATRPDESQVAAPLASLPARLAAAEMPGPVLVLIGRALGQAMSQAKETAPPTRQNAQPARRPPAPGAVRNRPISQMNSIGCGGRI